METMKIHPSYLAQFFEMSSPFTFHGSPPNSATRKTPIVLLLVCFD
jgi:hypothetical protein